MLSSISEFQKIIWDKWNVRVIIVFSLFLQIFLIFSAPSRKRTRSFFVSFVWLAYLLADWAAAYCIGLISSNQEQKPSLSQNDNLMAFWGPFLLSHLGGPHTISAFAMEDNELWLRHLLGLIFQSVMAAYVFLLTLPWNTLWIPTILMFVAGLIKYVERTYALYVAAINNFRESLYAELMEESALPIFPPATSSPSNALPANVDSLPLVRRAFSLFNRLQGLIVDMTYDPPDRDDVKAYFQSRTPQQALELIEIELNFMYEVFYTKASIVRQYWFWSWGKFVSLISIIAVFVLFIKAERHGGFDQLDVRVTYALLSGALFLNVIALVMRFFTDYTATLSDIHSHNASSFQILQSRLFKYLHERILGGFLNWRKPTWSKIKEGPYKDYNKLSTNFLFRRWSGSISGYNLLEYCLDESGRRDSKIPVFVQDFFHQRSGIKHLLDRWRYPSTNPFLRELWEYIQKKMSEKSDEAKSIKEMQSMCSARGERVVQEETLESLKEFVDPNEISFDESLLLWHVATTLRYYAKDATGMEGHKRKIISMILSDYMLYLLMKQPNMMSLIAGIGQIRFQYTCEEVKQIRERNISTQGDREAMLKEACERLVKVPIDTKYRPIDVKGAKSKSVVFDACRLAKELDKLEDKEWEVISSVWVELLAYAACHCRPTGHVQLLSKGGELISFVWLSMFHWGLSPQYQELMDFGSDVEARFGFSTLDMRTNQTLANDSLTRTFAGEDGNVNLQKPIGLKEDPAAPGICQPHTASNYLSKITNPIGTDADICPSPSRNRQREKQGEATTSSSMSKVNYC